MKVELLNLTIILIVLIFFLIILTPYFFMGNQLSSDVNHHHHKKHDRELENPERTYPLSLQEYQDTTKSIIDEENFQDNKVSDQKWKLIFALNGMELKLDGDKIVDIIPKQTDIILPSGYDSIDFEDKYNDIYKVVLSVKNASRTCIQKLIGKSVTKITIINNSHC